MVQVAETIPLDRRLFTRSRQERLAVDGQHTVTHAQFVIVAVGIVVPDMNTVFDQITDVGVALQKPEQFVDHPLQKDLLGRQQREPLAEIEPHLMAEDAPRTRSRAVTPHDAFVTDSAQQVEILFHNTIIF